MTPDATLARLREYMVGGMRFMTPLSCFELGVIDAPREKPGMTAAELGAAAGTTPDPLQQLLFLRVKDGLVGYGERTGGYVLDAVARADFFPAFFTGCALGQGGPQKLSAYGSRLEECGFRVTQAMTRDSAEISPDVIPVQAILPATKTA